MPLIDTSPVPQHPQPSERRDVATVPSVVQELPPADLRALALRYARAHDTVAAEPLIAEMERRGMEILTVVNILYPPVGWGVYRVARPLNAPRRRGAR